VSGEGRFVTARDGDCVGSIAEAHGLKWKTVWDHPENEELKRLRKDPNVIRSGDRVFVPDKRVKEETAASDATHRFRRKGVPGKLRLRFQDKDGKARSGVPYVLELDGKLLDGKTDGEGRVEVVIPPTARKGVLTLRDGEKEESYPLRLGRLDPVEEPDGARQRLRNLGYDTGDGGEAGLEKALKSFQAAKKLEATGALDEATQKALQDAHGC